MTSQVTPALTADQVAEVFGLSGPDILRQLRRAVERGAIPKPLPRVSRQPVWSAAVIARWLDTNGRQEHTPIPFRRSA